MITIKIDDGLCEWTYIMEEPHFGSKYSLNQMVDAICEKTDLKIHSSNLSKTYGLMDMVKNCLDGIKYDTP